MRMGEGVEQGSGGIELDQEKTGAGLKWGQIRTTCGLCFLTDLPSFHRKSQSLRLRMVEEGFY